MEIIEGMAELYGTPNKNMGWAVASSGDFETLYATLSTEASYMITTDGVDGDTTWNNKSWTLDYRGHAMTRKYATGSWGGSYPVGEYEYLLNEDGSTTITDNGEGAVFGPGGMGGRLWADDTSGAVTTVVVTATTLQIDQVVTNPPNHPDTTYTAHYKATWSSPVTATQIMAAAEALLAEKELIGAAEGCYMVEWVWAEGTARSKRVITDPNYSLLVWPWCWRNWSIESGGHYCIANACKERLQVTEEEFGVLPPQPPDLKRSEQTIFAPNTLASWETGYPNGTGPTWTGTYELIEGWTEIGDWEMLLPSLIGEYIPENYDGYDFGKAEIVKAT